MSFASLNVYDFGECRLERRLDKQFLNVFSDFFGRHSVSELDRHELPFDIHMKSKCLAGKQIFRPEL